MRIRRNEVILAHFAHIKTDGSTGSLGGTMVSQANCRVLSMMKVAISPECRVAV